MVNSSSALSEIYKRVVESKQRVSKSFIKEVLEYVQNSGKKYVSRGDTFELNGARFKRVSYSLVADGMDYYLLDSTGNRSMIGVSILTASKNIQYVSVTSHPVKNELGHDIERGKTVFHQFPVKLLKRIMKYQTSELYTVLTKRLESLRLQRSLNKKATAQPTKPKRLKV